jgi:hypothetical protein
MDTRTPSPEMLAALKEAVELRALGLSWEAVASQLERSPTTCRSWPSQYRREWPRLYNNAEKWLAREAGAEARVYLRKLLRSEDEKICLGAARLLLADRPKKLTRPRTAAPVSPEDVKLLAEMRSQTDDQIERHIDKYLADRLLPDGTGCAAGAEQPQ